MENNKEGKTDIKHPLPNGTEIVAYQRMFTIVKSSIELKLYYTKDNKGNDATVQFSEVDFYMGEIKDMVNHPQHYGGKDNPMEVIKIIDHYQLPFSLGNTLKYILRADKKANKLEDLKKAAWYLQHEITKLENV